MSRMFSSPRLHPKQVRPARRRVAVAAVSLLALTASCSTGDTAISSTDTTAAASTETTTMTGSDQSTSLSIAGTWVLTSLTVDDQPVTLPPDELTITIELGRITGNGGCNGFGGTIERRDDGGLAISDLVATEMACDQLDFEMIYLPLLSTATSWTGDPDGISFSGPTFTARYTQAA